MTATVHTILSVGGLLFAAFATTSRESFMGRQIHFYMLSQDQREFLRIIQERDSTTVVSRDSDSPEVEPSDGEVDRDS
jgi:hypothetical protein